MPKRKEPEKFAENREKDCWHSYGLQNLSPGKFSTVVGKILKGHYILINSRPSKRVSLRHFN